MSHARYDGELINLQDALARYRRDREIIEKYEQAEASEGQWTFDDVNDALTQGSEGQKQVKPNYGTLRAYE